MFEINVDPVAFSIGPLSIRWYGIAVAAGVMVLVLWTLRGAKQAGISPDSVFTAAMVGIPSGIVVSRLLHVIDLWEYYLANPGQIFGLGAFQGLTIWGAVLGASLGIFVYSRFARFPFGTFTDIAAPGILLAQSIGRVGCTLNGCCYGATTDAFCAIIYTDPDSFGPVGIPVHPTQVYEIVYLMLSFGVLMALRKRLKPDGALFMVYLSLYSLWRFGIGFLREGTAFAGGLQEAQVIALLVLGITIPVLATRARLTRTGTEIQPGP